MNKSIALLEHAEALANKARRPKPAGLAWTLKCVETDLRAYDGWRWPLPGSWAHASDPDLSNTDGCPVRKGDGLCLALTWEGMALAGRSSRTLLLVGYRESADVLGGDEDKIRVKQAYVREVIDGEDLVRRHGNGADLEGAYLTHMNLMNARLTETNLHCANLSGAYLFMARLDKADLSGALLMCTNLINADLRKANLRGAILRAANLFGADLTKADLGGAKLYGANLCESMLINTDFRDADLREANFSNADLIGTDFSGANLEDASFSGAELNGIKIDHRTRLPKELERNIVGSQTVEERW